MSLQEYIDSKNITKYRLSKISGVPKTTLTDICSGKSKLQNCSARTVQQLASALGCTMEDLLSSEADKYDDNGLPQNTGYLECGLPPYLQTSLENMVSSWKRIDSGQKDYRWDLYWNELNADINSAEIEQEISSNQAWYLREKYLRMQRSE